MCTKMSAAPEEPPDGEPTVRKRPPSQLVTPSPCKYIASVCSAVSAAEKNISLYDRKLQPW